MAPEEMLARAEGTDLIVNVFKDGGNGSYRTYPMKVRLFESHSCVGKFLSIIIMHGY